MTVRFRLACALVGVILGGCRQTVVLDDLGPDAGRPGTGGSGVAPGDASSDGRCFGNPAQPIPYTADVPQMLVALDRSSEMNQLFDGTQQTELSWALSSILSEVEGNNGRNSRRNIAFSFLDFPDIASDCNTTSCCASFWTDDYTNFYQQATCSLAGSTMCLESDNRPTTAALGRAIDFYDSPGSGSQHNDDRYVLLVTDGDPAGPCGADCNDAIMKAADLSNNMNVTTEVVVIGSDATCLHDAANAEGFSFLPYSVATTTAELSNTIDQIVQTVANDGCRLTLTQPTSGSLTVVFNEEIQQPDPGTSGNGWNYRNGTVFLHGDLCQNYLQGNPNSPYGLQIYDGCVSDRFSQAP